MRTSNLLQKLSALILAAAVLLPHGAEAYPKQGWYAGVAGGVGFQQDSDEKLGATTNKLEFDPGYVLSGSIGYGFEEQWRPEFELSYRHNTVDKASGTTAGARKGNFNSTAFMGNLFYDFQTNTGFTPYLGAGIGGAIVGADDAGTVFGTTLDSRPFEFAYQGIAGLSMELSERVEATLDYRYFATIDPDLKTKGGVSVSDSSYANHTFLIGLRYVFGEEREMPAPVPMRAAPRPVVLMQPQPVMQPPRPVAVQPPPPPVVPETYIVFFDFDKYYLSSEAKQTIQRAADAYRRGGVASVEVTGHTDTRGSNRYNMRLSQRRAKVVRDYMVALGVPEGEIRTRGAGESELMVPTANNVREAKNRRAEIVLRQ